MTQTVIATLPARHRPGDVSEVVDRKPCVGVLLVHGAGDHGTGATLVEFGEPLVSWLDGWLSHGEDSPTRATDAARVGATQILVREADSHAPAHAIAAIQAPSGTGPHLWLLAEARWDEAFTPPAFGQVLRWAIGVVPWTVLTQFIGPLARQSRFVEPKPLSVLGFLSKVIVATTTALVAAAVLQAFALAILVLSIVPIAAVRDLVSRLQRFASTGVGDLYMVLSSPIQRAALTSAVQRDIDWLRDQGCERIAVIAHSQGGYVAYQALADPWHRRVELFITFGSGLIRLTESERARRSGVLVQALIGTLGALIAVRFLPVAILGEAGIWGKQQASGLAFFVGVLVSLVLIPVLWRYFHDTIRVPDLPSRIRWFDYLTKEDPVMNRHRKGRLPDRVCQVRTQNQGSVRADHGSYWLNSDEFVPQVARQISRMDPGFDLMRAGPKADWTRNAGFLQRSYDRRHGRVSALRLRGALLIAATLGLIVVRAGELSAVGQPVSTWFSQLPDVIRNLVPDLIRSVLPIDGLELVLLGAAVIAAISALAARIGSGLWDAWGTADTLDQWAGRERGELSRAALAFHGWTIFHLIALEIAAIVGPAAIVNGLRYFAENRDQVVQAWASMYLWSLAVGAVVATILILRRPSPRRIAIPARLIVAMVLAMAVELRWAMIKPGPMHAIDSIPTAVVTAIVAIIVVWLGWPVLKQLIKTLAKVGERDREEKHEAAMPATVVDYLGVIGGWIAALAALAALAATWSIVGLRVVDVPSFQPVAPAAFWRFTAILAAAGLFVGVMTAANSRGLRFPRQGPMTADLVIGRALEPSMQVVGLVAAIVSALALVLAVARFLALPGSSS